MTRLEKYREKRYWLKRESEQIKYIIDNAIEDNYNMFEEKHSLDKLMGNPMQELEKVFEVKK